MKAKTLLAALFLIMYSTGMCQIKIFDDDWVTIGTIQRYGHGIRLDDNKVTFFSPSVYDDWCFQEVSLSTNPLAKNWIVELQGIHTFFVQGDGWIYSRGNYLGCDSTFKKDIGEINNPLIKVLRLHGIMYNCKTKQKDSIKNVQESAKKTGDYNSDSRKNSNKINPVTLKRINEEKKQKHYGVIAQEVEKVSPELVRMMPDSTLAVEYSGLIALLIEAIKEQQTIINQISSKQELLFRMNAEGNFKTTLKYDSVTSNYENFLYQNSPNPFNQNTVIRYKISYDAKEASIIIFNIQGELLKTYSNLDINGDLVIQGSDYKPGIYLYSLIVNGMEIATKRMILTNQ